MSVPTAMVLCVQVLTIFIVAPKTMISHRRGLTTTDSIDNYSSVHILGCEVLE